MIRSTKLEKTLSFLSATPFECKDIISVNQCLLLSFAFMRPIQIVFFTIDRLLLKLHKVSWALLFLFLWNGRCFLVLSLFRLFVNSFCWRLVFSFEFLGSLHFLRNNGLACHHGIFHCCAILCCCRVQGIGQPLQRFCRHCLCFGAFLELCLDLFHVLLVKFLFGDETITISRKKRTKSPS